MVDDTVTREDGDGCSLYNIQLGVDGAWYRWLYDL